MKPQLFLTNSLSGTAGQWCLTLVDCLRRRGQEFGPLKTTPEKMATTGAVSAKSLVLSLRHFRASSVQGSFP